MSPDRLHGAGGGPRPCRLRDRDHAPAHARLLQGRAVPRRRLGDARHERRGGHAPATAACASYMPITFATFGLGYLAIIGVPPFAGFFSKDAIIETAFAAGGVRGLVLGGAALLGAGITAFYMTRVMLMTFFGEKRWAAWASEATGEMTEPHPHESPAIMTWPMIVLAIGSVGAGGAARHRRHPGALARAGRRRARSARRDFRCGSMTVVTLVGRRGRRRHRLPDVRDRGRYPRPRRDGLGAHRGRPQRPLRRRVQRGRADAAGPDAHRGPGLRSTTRPSTGRPAAWPR